MESKSWYQYNIDRKTKVKFIKLNITKQILTLRVLNF